MKLGLAASGIHRVSFHVMSCCRLAERMPLADLTPRESEVLGCITRGRSNRQIAEDLRIAEKTVRIHVSAVLNKMGVRDRTQATILALQRGLIHLDEPAG